MQADEFRREWAAELFRNLRWAVDRPLVFISGASMPATFTPTEQKMYDLLRDGKLHRREELHACLQDELQNPAVVRNWMDFLRKKIPTSQSIVSVRDGSDLYYQLVRRLRKE